MKSDSLALPLGYKAAGIHCGIKRSRNPDLGLIFSQAPALTVAAFTSNKIQAAPVLVSREHLGKNDYARAIIANSGNANCFTKAAGKKDAVTTSAIVADNLNIAPEEVLVASTGIIGRKLPMDKIKSGVPVLIKRLSKHGFGNFARAILTTDTVIKKCGVSLKIRGKTVTICIAVKGVGMIAPDMKMHATMLAFCLTDADIDKKAFHAAAEYCVNRSFNNITIDGCMSTNDTVFFMANGLAGNARIKTAGRDFRLFQAALAEVCLKSARAIIRDAEGATKFITVKVNGARNDSQARTGALAIANSNLVKSAIFGENPNFGRVVAAIGACGIDLDEGGLEVSLSPLKKRDIEINVNLRRGRGSATVYTSDLSYEYVRINAEYN